MATKNTIGLRPNYEFLQTKEFSTKSFDVSAKQAIIDSDKPISEKLFDLVEDYCENNGHKFNREGKFIVYTVYSIENFLNENKYETYKLFLNIMIRKGKIILRASNQRKNIVIDLGKVIFFNNYLRKRLLEGSHRSPEMGYYSNQRTEIANLLGG